MGGLNGQEAQNNGVRCMLNAKDFRGVTQPDLVDETTFKGFFVQYFLFISF